VSKTPIESHSNFRPDPNRAQPPIDEGVQLPHQVRRAAARANALSTGQPVLPIPQPNKTGPEPKISYTDAEIDEALEQWDRGGLNITDPNFERIIELARVGARLIKAHRRGAREPRKISDKVTRRLEALLQAYRELSPKQQKNLTGTMTLRTLRRSIIKKLGLRDDGEVIPEDTIKHDIRQVRPLLRLIEQGIIPPTGKPDKQRFSERTRQEVEAGKSAVAKAASANKPRRRSARGQNDKAE
jgi:hypothetical protein